MPTFLAPELAHRVLGPTDVTPKLSPFEEQLRGGFNILGIQMVCILINIQSIL